MMSISLRASWVWCLKLRMIDGSSFPGTEGFQGMWGFQGQLQNNPQKTRAAGAPSNCRICCVRKGYNEIGDKMAFCSVGSWNTILTLALDGLLF